MSALVHGGRIDDAMAVYGGDRGRWIDLSTGINPWPYPIPTLGADVWGRLPEQQRYDACCAAARERYCAPADAAMSLAPGSQMHIQLLPTLYRPQDVAIVGFTYQEHAYCWERAGHSVFVTDGLASAEATARIIIVVNPNNPDGRIHSREELLAVAKRLAVKGGLLVVDEAFADPVPGVTLAPYAGRKGLFILRSFGKFYGLAGVRLGIAMGEEAIIRELNERLGPWAVSGPALAIAESAFADTRWTNRTIKKLDRERVTLEDALSEAGLTIVGGTPLFTLASHDDAAEIADLLARDHILVRSFPGRPHWLRFGLPATKGRRERLLESLANAHSAGA